MQEAGDYRVLGRSGAQIQVKSSLHLYLLESSKRTLWHFFLLVLVHHALARGVLGDVRVSVAFYENSIVSGTSKW